jgi:LuxR family transcriptional regulator, maltose regulon positive regulatory protein
MGWLALGVRMRHSLTERSRAANRRHSHTSPTVRRSDTMRGGYDDPAMGTSEGNGDFGGELRRYRESAGLSQEELAERAGLTAKGISALERGERQRPYPQTVRALAEALNLSDADRSALIGAVPRRARSEHGRREAQEVATLDKAGPLLETKFYSPRPPRSVVARPRLTERLNRVVESKLALVSAPAGFGKTTLLAEWLAAARDGKRSVAWLSLDQGDNEPAPFWTYLIAALQTLVPGVGESALSLLQGPQPPPVEAVLTTLLNELSAVPDDVVLVLDDYHVVDAPDVQDGMAFLLEHLPPQMHLVIATRADPAVPLARLRAKGELVEIRAADLRFTRDEAAAYLNEAMGLALTAPDVAALEGRTEGWIAALQLAALSMRDRDDIAGFIAGFAGDDRYIVDYLVEEVLQRRPEAVRSFLLQTSILDRLSGPLCDAVTGHAGGKAMLEALDRGNLFLVPLDDRRQWYRYHHLFADVLRARLLDEHPDRVHQLHERASDWYAQNGEPSEAIRHAMAGEDFERAAGLIELAIPAMRRSRHVLALRRFIETLPDELIRARPVLTVGYVGALMASGELEDVERRLQDAEHWLTATQGLPDEPGAWPPGMVVVDRDEFRFLAASIALYRAVLAQIRGDVSSAGRHAQKILELAPEDDDLSRGAAAAILGLVAWASGDLEAAHRIYADGMARVERAGNVADAIGAAIALADIRITQGRLREAMQTYEQALQLSTKHAEPVLSGTADMYVGLADIVREQGDLQAATQHLQTGKDLGEHMGFPQNRHRSHVVTARIREARGDLNGALDALHEAERLRVPDFNPDVRPLSAMVARVWVRLGWLAEANSWAREQGLSAEDDLSYLREFEHITLARLVMVQSKRDGDEPSTTEGQELLRRLLIATEEGQRTGSMIEILVLQALAHQTRGDIAGALAPLKRALTLAEPEGYVRTFLDEGPPIAALLGAAARHGITPNYVRHLLASYGGADGSTPLKHALVEPLSERELDVLRLLATNLDGPDIARELVIALSTIRTHTKSIYAKLGVNSRRAAVRRAEELDLLSRARDSQPRPVVVHDA